MHGDQYLMSRRRGRPENKAKTQALPPSIGTEVDLVFKTSGYACKSAHEIIE